MTDAKPVIPLAPVDGRTIDPDDVNEVEYWKVLYGCSQAQLRKIVEFVGPRAADVERELQRRIARP